jgi:hypothetical protein
MAGRLTACLTPGSSSAKDAGGSLLDLSGMTPFERLELLSSAIASCSAVEVTAAPSL